MNEHEKPQIDFMHKLARQIVERRNLVFLFVVLATIFTVFAVKWVKVETDMTTYLPKTSETRLGLDIMEDQFTTYGSADVMVANITPEQAAALEPKIKEIKGVQSVDYDETFGFEADLHPKNIIDSKHFEVKTPDVVIKVDPARSDLIETRVIGGVKYILISADESVEVNGVNINIADSEKETANV